GRADRGHPLPRRGRRQDGQARAPGPAHGEHREALRPERPPELALLRDQPERPRRAVPRHRAGIQRPAGPGRGRRGPRPPSAPPRLDMLIAEMYELLHGTVSTIRDNKAEIAEVFEGMRRTLKGTGDFMEHNKGHLDKIAENAEKITVDADDLVRGAKGKFVENPQVDHILANAEKVSGDAARDLPPMLADGRAAIASARRVADIVGDPKEQGKLRQTLDDV